MAFSAHRRCWPSGGVRWAASPPAGRIRAGIVIKPIAHKQRKQQNRFPELSDALFFQKDANQGNERSHGIGNHNAPRHPPQGGPGHPGTQKRGQQQDGALQHQQHRRRRGQQKREHVPRAFMPGSNARADILHTEKCRLGRPNHPAVSLMQGRHKSGRLFVVKHRILDESDPPPG